MLEVTQDPLLSLGGWKQRRPVLAIFPVRAAGAFVTGIAAYTRPVRQDCS